MKRYHGIVILLYYIAAFTGVILMAHPYLLVFLYVILSVKEKSIIKAFVFDLLFGCFIVIINVLVNHRGPTELMTLFGMRLTEEALFYGIQIALVFLVCIKLFKRLSHEMTDEKVLSVMAGRLPGLALVFSMLLRLVPDVRKKAKRIKKINKVNSVDNSGTGHRARLFSTVFSLTLEDGIIRSISMNDRGYGTDKRTSFYKRKIKPSDILLILLIIVFIAIQIVFVINGTMDARYFPTMKVDGPVWYVILPWCLFYALPLIIEGKEELKWRLSMRRSFASDMQAVQNRR